MEVRSQQSGPVRVPGLVRLHINSPLGLARPSNFRKLFNENDLIFLSEPKRDTLFTDILDWGGVFIEFNKNVYRDFRKGKSSGETHLVIRKIIEPYCTVIKHDTYRAWVSWFIIKAIYLRIVIKM